MKTTALIALFVVLTSCAHHQRHRAVFERPAVEDTIVTLFNKTDAKDWSAVRAAFADQVKFDMTSLAGGQPSVMTPQQITDGWEKGLKDILQIHHQSGNFLVTIDGKSATASCYGVAYHYKPGSKGGNTRTFVGSYDFHLQKSDADVWKIDSFKFNLKFIDGNLKL
jgi:hypothetical protein